MDINFEKNYTRGGNEICGTICVRYIGNDQKYLACGLSMSKCFKTLKGAEKYMESKGYKAA